MTVKDFVKGFYDKKIENTKINPHAVEDYLIKTLEIKEYIPIEMKIKIVTSLVEENTVVKDGITTIDFLNQQIGFVIAMIMAHTNLQFSENPMEDYDILAESELLTHILSVFEKSYSECSVYLKMKNDETIAYNDIEANITQVLNKVSNILDGVLSKLEGANFDEYISKLINQDTITALGSFFNK